MKNLSLWALLNPKKTIAILSVVHMLLAVLAFYLGVLLFAEGIILPKSLIYLSIFVYLMVHLFYPIRRARYKFWKPNYARQKVLDLIVVAACLLAVTTHTNIEADAAWNAGEDTAGFVQSIVHKPIIDKSNDGVSKSFWKSKKERRKQRKILKKKFREFVKDVKKNNKNKNGGKIGGVVFLIILGMIVVAALACLLFASEAGFMGYLVLFGGWILVITLGVKSIRKLKGKKPKNYKPSTRDD
jgi:hypothetical protein